MKYWKPFSWQELHNTFSTWDKYHHLWRVDKEMAIREFTASSPTLQDYDRTLRSYVLLDKQIKSEPSRYRVGALAVNTGEVQRVLVILHSVSLRM